MFDFTGGYDHRFRYDDNPRRKRWNYFTDKGSNCEELFSKLAQAIQEVANQVRNSAGMDNKMWAVSSPSLVYTLPYAERGPPTVSTTTPGYHAFVNLGCCLESLLLNDTHDSDEIQVEDALDFIGFETDYLKPEEFLSRRPDVESWLYKVRTSYSPTTSDCFRLSQTLYGL